MRVGARRGRTAVTAYIPSIYPPPKSGPGYIPISGPAAGGPPGPPGVLFGGHRGQFGSWGAPQSRNCTCYLLIDAPMVSVLTMVFVGADTGHKQTSCPYGPITMTCSDSRDPDLARCCSEPRDVAACAELLTIKVVSAPFYIFLYWHVASQ